MFLIDVIGSLKEYWDIKKKKIGILQELKLKI